MKNYEEFIKLLKEQIEESNSNQCNQEKDVEYDPDIIFDQLMADSQFRIKVMIEWHNDFRHDMVKLHAIKLAENLVNLLNVLDEENYGKK